jgi:thiol-disulfide isomerase/thioredoxin
VAPVLLASKLLLILLFATAGLAKLADLEGSRRAVARFGVPKRLAWPLGTLLPLVELAAAGALLPHRSDSAAAVAVLVLLLGFSLAIALNLLRGRTPECHCFGQLHSMPVSWRVVGRNLALAALAAALVAGEPARLGLFESTSVAVVLGCSALLLVARRARRREVRGPVAAAGLPFGSPAPDFELPLLTGGEITLRSLLDRGKPVLLVFADTSCGPCRALAPELAAWQAEGADVTIAVLERGARPAAVDEYGRSLVLCPPDESVAQAYRAAGTPSAVLVDRSGRIASSIAPGAPGIRRLVAGEALAAPAHARERRLTRLELVAKLASAGLVLTAWRAAPALAGGTPILALCKYGPRCGGRCCPKTARCRQRAGKKVCVCPDGREACGSKCCPPTFLCRRTARGKKVCVCPPRTRPCRGRCVPLTDPAHCGACGRTCPPATVCVSGQCVGGDGSGTGPGGSGECVCPPGQTCCDGGCVDLNLDEAHCGRCDQPCPEGQTCCDGTCRDLRADGENCGECGARCRQGLVCNEGRCGSDCPEGKKLCSGQCVTPSSDHTNCGGCPGGSGGENCINLTCCSGECVHLGLSDEHCSGCNIPCPPPRFCRFGECVCPLGVQCPE